MLWTLLFPTSFRMVTPRVAILVVTLCLLFVSQAREGFGSKEAVESDSYQLQSGDRLEIRVYREDDLSGTYEIDPAGQISFPLVGELQAAGLGIDQFRNLLETSLQKYLVQPQVRITRLEGLIKSISVLGQAAKPGTYDYLPGSTLMRLISSAGGFSELANKKKIKIVRMADGKKKVIVVNGLDVVNGKEDDPEVRPGDIIFIPESVF